MSHGWSTGGHPPPWFINCSWSILGRQCPPPTWSAMTTVSHRVMLVIDPLSWRSHPHIPSHPSRTPQSIWRKKKLMYISWVVGVFPRVAIVTSLNGDPLHVSRPWGRISYFIWSLVAWHVVLEYLSQCKSVHSLTQNPNRYCISRQQIPKVEMTFSHVKSLQVVGPVTYLVPS